MVGDLDQRLAALDARRHLDRRPGRRVVRGVGDEVQEHLAQARLVAEDADIVGVEPVLAVGVHHALAGDDVVHEAPDVDAVPLERSLAIEPREQQQVVDERRHAGRLALDAAHREREVLGPVGGAAPEQLGVAADGGQRRAQLVRGVGGEAAEALLGRAPLGDLALDLGEHAVERDAQAPDLALAIAFLDALGQVAARDHGRRLRHALERPQAAQHDQPCRDADGHERDAADDELGDEDLIEGRVDVVQGKREDEREGADVGRVGHREPAVARLTDREVERALVVRTRVRVLRRAGQARREAGERGSPVVVTTTRPLELTMPKTSVLRRKRGPPPPRLPRHPAVVRREEVRAHRALRAIRELLVDAVDEVGLHDLVASRCRLRRARRRGAPRQASVNRSRRECLKVSEDAACSRPLAPCG